MTRLCSRLGLYRLLALVSAGTLAYSLYLQYIVGETPCTLCLLQRFALIPTLVFLIVLALKAWQGLSLRILQTLALLCALTGAGLAGRQIWLQHSPDGMSMQCLPNLGYMLQHYPLLKTIEMALHGSSDCALVTSTIFNISLATWSGLFFSLLSLFIFISFFMKKNKANN
ncbi:disulfide bond formation protein B [Piscirickettsia litoralis]|uniref:Disulfide bond formation protein DsbB n=1 Tax=Piscirickettsia litoralis TaxID=1891921 RepID=A0ABX3A5Q7_9GAMM|nr:disulfide bond formation protein B [Piscirickettsia litoralis]ODN42785.1 disulfide bond formation protein DsbB [Piscirickettsia litoralis]